MEDTPSIPKIQHTPPVSPSFLRVGMNPNNNNGDYFKPSRATKDEFVFTTRSSSLNRTTCASGKSIVHLSPSQRVPNSPQLFSNPTSPLAFEITPSFGQEIEFPNYALFSYISNQFTNKVLDLNQHRKIFCSEEYPQSFNGEEALVC